MIKIKLSVIIIFCIMLISCEDLEELITTVSGKVHTDNCKVVMAVKGEDGLFDYLDKVSKIDSISICDAKLFRGFDIGIGEDSLYKVTMLSFGETYFLAVVDDGVVSDELDTLDHVGFYCEFDTLVTIPYINSDTTFIYSIPKKIIVEEGTDESDIDIKNFIEFKWFIKIYETIN
jgi:hypothetical protein